MTDDHNFTIFPYLFTYTHIRGLIAAGFGPLILAIVYYCLHQAGIITNLSVNEVAWGIFSTFLLAFVQGGAGAVFTIEKLSMKKATTIDFILIYFTLLMVYLLNGWMTPSWIVIGIFTLIFIIGYFIIWTIIYQSVKKSIKQINAKL